MMQIDVLSSFSQASYFHFLILIALSKQQITSLNGLHGANQRRKNHTYSSHRVPICLAHFFFGENLSKSQRVTAKQNAHFKMLTPLKPTELESDQIKKKKKKTYTHSNTFYRSICRPVLYLLVTNETFRFLVWGFLFFFSSFFSRFEFQRDQRYRLYEHLTRLFN